MGGRRTDGSREKRCSEGQGSRAGGQAMAGGAGKVVSGAGVALTPLNPSGMSKSHRDPDAEDKLTDNKAGKGGVG